MDPPSEGRGLVARARAFVERHYYYPALFDEAEKTAEAIERAGGSHAQMAAAYLNDAVRLGIVDREFIRSVFGEEVEGLIRD